jgi:hypothetical protein
MPDLIIQTDSDHHLVFGSYVLNKTSQGIDLFSPSGDFVCRFGNQRSALSFCIAEKFRRYNLAAQIRNLDAKHTHLTNDIACRQAMAENSDRSTFKELVHTKISTKIHQRRAVANELEKCINLAKYLQIKGFQNETARVFTS